MIRKFFSFVLDFFCENEWHNKAGKTRDEILREICVA